ncbi:MAG: alkaline phosphatase family protein [Mariniblastus sp.]
MNFKLIRLLNLAVLLFASISVAQDKDTTAVDDQRVPTGQRVQPAGEVVSFYGRPVDLKIGPNGKLLFAKDRSALRIIEIESMKLVQTVKSPGGASLIGLAVSKTGDVYFTNSKQEIHVFSPTKSSEQAGDKPTTYELAKTIKLPAASFPCGIKISDDEKTAYVCLSKKNSVVLVDLGTDEIKQTIDVGIAPFDLIASNGKLIVSNIGGRRPTADDKTADSGGSETVVDKRGIASTGTVSIINLATNKIERHVTVGRHPSALSLTSEDGLVTVCNTNDDSTSTINIATGETSDVDVKPGTDIPFGSMPSAIHLVQNGLAKNRSFVALAGNNAVGLIGSAAATGKQEVRSLIPTAWYPVAIESNETHLFVACVKGLGSRAITRAKAKGRNSHDHFGTIQKIPFKQILDEEQMAKWSAQAFKAAKIPLQNAANQMQNEGTTADVDPVPIPKKLGEPSVFKHVIYVIKENRTFDQVFGDIKEARSEPALCVFPEKVTPNHHALARRFGILDNYYCNGVLSADGHSWAIEGNVTPYLERAFGGFARSYTFGNDPITYSSSGFLWDHILDAGLSFRNYGEYDYAKPPSGMKYQEIWKNYSEGTPIEFTQNIGIERLRRYSCRDYPGWNMLIPDVLRMDRFLKEFKDFKKDGGLPSLCLVYLPQDHLGGGITSRSHMADNDLAIGRLVEAVSNSEYWKDTVIFINEDDPQNGYDHIDGHRSICLPISAYSKTGINHQFYNQTSVLRTILHIFGLPPMNQQDAASPLMSDCFEAKPNFDAYKSIDANFPLNEAPPSKKQQSAIEQKWRGILATVPIERTGMKTEKDEDNLNRFVWYEVKGWETPYPTDWSGAHGKGLEKLGLSLDPDSDE